VLQRLVSGHGRKYQIIYADPAWSYYNDTTLESPKLVKEGGMRYPPYPVMASAEIKQMPVEAIAADDAVLLIWTTDYHLERAIGVINAWGFQYKTIGFAWQKTNRKGEPVCFMGAYTMKTGIELCLLATRGKNAHKMVKKFGVRGRVESPREHHSKKPDEVRNRIVEMFGDRPRIELFARERHDGWDAWGNDVALVTANDKLTHGGPTQ
jgi:N6-adenosine-specific RNA methylase IME4